MFFKRSLIFTLFLMNFLYFSHLTTPGVSFTYYPGSLYEEIQELSFNLTLSNGEHVLVIDNSGYAAGQKSSTRQSTNLDYEIKLPINCTPQPTDVIIGRSTLDPLEFYWINFSLTISGDKTGVGLFSINASNKVSVFVTDVEGFYEFWYETIDSPTFPSGPVLILGGLAIAALIIGMVVLRHRSQKLSRRLTQMPKSDKSETNRISPHKAISLSPSHDLKAAYKQAKKAPTAIYCINCGELLSDNRGFCAFCGAQQSSLRDKNYNDHK